LVNAAFSIDLGHPTIEDENMKQGKLEYVVIVTGNPGVFQGYPYPYPGKPAPANKGRGFGGSG
jgi:hypothetical protein